MRALVCVVVFAAACGASSAEVRKARSAQYQTELDVVWARTLQAIRADYPVVRVMDRENRRIVTCWRPIERSANASSATSGAFAWYLYRAVIEISPNPPYRVSVSGRTAVFQQPQVIPIEHGDVNEPGWIEGRTNRVILQVHEALKEFATPTNEMSPRASDPGTPENIAETCVIRAEELGIPGQGQNGIVIGDPGAAPQGNSP